jgi:hypothetical protein
MVMVKVKRIKIIIMPNSLAMRTHRSLALWAGVLPLKHGEQRSCHRALVHSAHLHATAVINGVCVSKGIVKRVRDISRVPASTMTTFWISFSKNGKNNQCNIEKWKEIDFAVINVKKTYSLGTYSCHDIRNQIKYGIRYYGVSFPCLEYVT